MNRVHIIGRRNAGKTTFIVEVIAELLSQGHSAGTIKHSSHVHELDTPGKDSHRHRIAGASPAAVVTPVLTGIYLPTVVGEAGYAKLAPHYAACDVVLVEGDQTAAAVKVEVWRAEIGIAPIAAERSDVAAIITDDDPALAIPRWPRSDLRRVAALLVELARGTRAPS